MKRPFVLAGTYGAQTGMNGAIRLVRKKILQAEVAFIGEPTGLNVCGAGMGLATVDIFLPFSEQERSYRESHDLMESSSTQSKVFLGKSAHSSAPETGENAIAKALAYLEQLPEGVALMDFDGGLNYNSVPAQAFLEVDFVGALKDPAATKLVRLNRALAALEKKMKMETDARFKPDHATLNLGLIRTSGAGIKISGSCRIPPGISDTIYRDWMNDLNVVCNDMGASFSVKDYRRGFDSMQDETAASVLRQATQVNEGLGLPSSIRALSVTTEASVFARMGIACVVYGAGDGVGNSHEPDEKVSLSDLEKSVEFYRKSIERFCI